MVKKINTGAAEINYKNLDGKIVGCLSIKVSAGSCVNFS